MITTIYSIPAPDTVSAKIEVYGEPENAWYEWRIVDGNQTVRDTKKYGYGQAEIALRDALIFASGMPVTC